MMFKTSYDLYLRTNEHIYIYLAKKVEKHLTKILFFYCQNFHQILFYIVHFLNPFDEKYSILKMMFIMFTVPV